MILCSSATQKTASACPRFIWMSPKEAIGKRDVVSHRSSGRKDLLHKKQNDILSVAANPEVRKFLAQRLSNLSRSVDQKRVFEKNNWIHKANENIDKRGELRRVKKYFEQVSQTKLIELKLNTELSENSINGTYLKLSQDFSADLSMVLDYSREGIVHTQNLSKRKKRKLKKLAEFLADNKLTADEIDQLKGWRDIISSSIAVESSNIIPSVNNDFLKKNKGDKRESKLDKSENEKKNLPIMRAKLKKIETWSSAHGLVSCANLMREITAQLDGDNPLTQGLGQSLNYLADYFGAVNDLFVAVSQGDVKKAAHSLAKVSLGLGTACLKLLDVVRHVAVNLIDSVTRVVDDIGNLLLGDAEAGMANQDSALVGFIKRCQAKKLPIPFLERAKDLWLEGHRCVSQVRLGMIHGFTEYFRCTCKTLALPEKVLTEIFTTLRPLLQNVKGIFADVFNQFDLSHLSPIKLSYGLGYAGIIAGMSLWTGAVGLLKGGGAILSMIGKILEIPGKIVSKLATSLVGKIGSVVGSSGTATLKLYDAESALSGAIVVN